MRARIWVGVAAVAMLALAGCHYVGSGTMPSATGSGEAVFSFNLNCPAGGTVQFGDLTYTDRPAGVLIHGNASGPIPPNPFTGTCASNAFSISFAEGQFSGTYFTLDGRHATGTFRVTVTAGRSAPPALAGAHFSITLEGAITYFNSGTVTAGQIQPIGGPAA